MRVKDRFAEHDWQRDGVILAVLLLLGFLYFAKVGTLVPGPTPAENEAIASSKTLLSIVNNPLNAPHKLLQYGVQKAGFDSIAVLRVVSGAFAILLVVTFHRLVRKWYSKRIALLTTCLLATSSWLLAIGRSATPNILLSSWFFVIFLLLWFRHSRNVKLAPPLLLLSLTALLYIPGTVYLVGLIAIWYATSAPTFFRFMKKLPITTGLIAGGLLLAPLIISFVRQPSLLSDWLLLPDQLTIGDFLQNIRGLGTTFFYQSLPNPEFWLGRLPLLDALTGTMVLLGVYSYRFHLRMERTPLLALVILLGIIVIGAAGPQLVFLLLPFVYVLVASGLAYLLERWFNVFPRNPVARALGTTLVSVAVIFAGYYHLNRYFVAWPNAPETKAIHSIEK